MCRRQLHHLLPTWPLSFHHRQVKTPNGSSRAAPSCQPHTACSFSPAQPTQPPPWQAQPFSLPLAANGVLPSQPLPPPPPPPPPIEVWRPPHQQQGQPQQQQQGQELQSGVGMGWGSQARALQPSPQVGRCCNEGGGGMKALLLTCSKPAPAS